MTVIEPTKESAGRFLCKGCGHPKYKHDERVIDHPCQAYTDEAEVIACDCGAYIDPLLSIHEFELGQLRAKLEVAEKQLRDRNKGAVIMDRTLAAQNRAVFNLEAELVNVRSMAAAYRELVTLNVAAGNISEDLFKMVELGINTKFNVEVDEDYDGPEIPF